MRRPKDLLVAIALVLCAFGIAATSASAAPPVVTMGTVDGATYTTAHATGEVDPEGEVTEWFFEVSKDGGASWEGGGAGGSVGGTDPVPVEGTLQGLRASTTYKVRITAFNYSEFVNVSSPEPNPEITTEHLDLPTVSIDPVTTFTGTTAHFSGEIDPEAPAGNPPAADVNWHFECTPFCPGLTGGSIPADSASHEVSDDASGLDPNTVYEVKLVATNAAGPAEDSTSFETDPVAPDVETLYAGSLGTTSATLAANVNPRGSAVEYQFEWGVGDAFDQVAPAAPESLGAADQSYHWVSAPISGLQEGADYRFRVAVTNTETGTTVTGAAHNFSTLSAPSPEGGCANAEVRSEQASSSLPDCRAYEQVSPQLKNGGQLTRGITSTPDGNRIASFSLSSFSDPKSNILGIPYVSTRNSDGWSTVNLAPKAGVSLGVDGFTQAGIFTADLSTAYTTTRSWEQEPGFDNKNIAAVGLDGSETWLTAANQPDPQFADKYLGGLSADGQHVVFESTENFSPQDTEGKNVIWDWDHGEIKIVSVMPDGSLADGVKIGAAKTSVNSSSSGTVASIFEPNVVSTDGSRIFFKASPVGPPQLYVREDGTHTIQVSLSQKPGQIGESSENGVQYEESSPDGSEVLFSTTDELTADATPGGGLYRYDLESGILHFLTPALVGSAQFEGVVANSADLSRVYFVARGQLLPGEGQPGQPNLYVSSDGDINLIAVLSERDKINWSIFNTMRTKAARATPDGENLAFQSVNPLVGYESQGHVEIYQWDNQVESLRCVSCGPAGTDADGDASLLSSPVDLETGFRSTSQVGDPRGLTDDGSKVYFQTTDSLDPRDVNGKYDVYASEDGRISLISGGTSDHDSEIIDNSPTGSNVFFTTTQTLVPQDIDGGAGDIYDARVEGGFAAVPPPTPCEAKCQPLAGVPTFSPPASAALNGAGVAHSGKARKLRKALKACRKKPKKARMKCEARAKKHFGTKGA